MDKSTSVTLWLARLKAGEDRDEAVARLWRAYFTRLVERARRHLRGRRAVKDEEDAALSAFDGFVRAVEAGRFPKLDDRHDLWQVLLRMTANKVRNAVRDEGRARRGGGRVREVASGNAGGCGPEVLSAEPDPADAVALAEEADQRLVSLGDPELRRVAELALAGHTNEAVAAAIGKSVATAERKLRRIRELWGGP